MNKVIYGFQTDRVFRNYLQIKEYKVVKETDKMFVIEGCVWSNVRKATMSVGSIAPVRFFLTKEEAVKGVIEYCKNVIRYNEITIEALTNDNIELKDIIRTHGGNIDE